MPQLLLQLVEQVEHLRLHREVQRGHRLVADDHVGVERQRAGDADALTLAAGELLRVLVGRLGAEADEVEQAADLHVAVLAALVHAFVGAPRLGDDVAGRHPGVQRRVGVLEDHLHAAAELQQFLAAQANGSMPSKLHGALVRTLQHQQCAGQRGLAAAGLADQAEGLAALEVEGDAVERAQPLLAGVGHAERLAQVADLEQVLRHSITSSGKWQADLRPVADLDGVERRPLGRADLAGQRAAGLVDAARRGSRAGRAASRRWTSGRRRGRR